MDILKFTPIQRGAIFAFGIYTFISGRRDDDVIISYRYAISEIFTEKFAKEAFEIHSNQQPIGESLAKEAFMARHEVEVDYKSKYSFFAQAVNSYLSLCMNLYLYGNTQGPSFEQLIAKNNAEDFFYSTFTGGRDLGLQGNNMGKYIKLAQQSVCSNEQGEEYTAPTSRVEIDFKGEARGAYCDVGEHDETCKNQESTFERGVVYTHYNDLYPEHFLLYDIMKQDGKQEVVRILGEENSLKFNGYLPYIEAQLSA